MNPGDYFTLQQKYPTAISATFPVRVTIPNHGMTAGQYIRASNFATSPLSLRTGMEQLNYNLYVIGNVTTNQFDLFDTFGRPIDGTQYTPFVNNGLALFTLTGPELDTQNIA